MAEHSPGSGQVLILEELGGKFLAVVGGALDSPAHAGDVDEATTVVGYVKQIVGNSEMLVDHISHEALIFPEATNLDVILTAHSNADTWSDWAEIVDTEGTPVSLSSKFTAHKGHVVAMSVEDTDVAGTVFMVQVAYGAAKTVVGTHRARTGTNNLPTAQVERINGACIPAGETVYYRAMCETAGSKTLTVNFRYFLHG